MAINQNLFDINKLNGHAELDGMTDYYVKYFGHKLTSDFVRFELDKIKNESQNTIEDIAKITALNELIDGIEYFLTEFYDDEMI